MVKQQSKSGIRARREKASRVVDAVELQDVRLKEAFVRQSLRRGDLPTVETHVTLEISKDQAKSVLTVMPKCRLVGVYDDTENTANDVGDYPLVIIAEFHLTYRAESLVGFTNNNLKAFGEQTGLFNVWPYWREFVMSTMGRLGLPPLVIPLLKFTARDGAVKPARSTRK